jgi:hypothetical protein
MNILINIGIVAKSFFVGAVFTFLIFCGLYFFAWAVFADDKPSDYGGVVGVYPDEKYKGWSWVPSLQDRSIPSADTSSQDMQHMMFISRLNSDAGYSDSGTSMVQDYRPDYVRYGYTQEPFNPEDYGTGGSALNAAGNALHACEYEKAVLLEEIARLREIINGQ